MASSQRGEQFAASEQEPLEVADSTLVEGQFVEAVDPRSGVGQQLVEHGRRSPSGQSEMSARSCMSLVVPGLFGTIGASIGTIVQVKFWPPDVAFGTSRNAARARRVGRYAACLGEAPSKA